VRDVIRTTQAIPHGLAVLLACGLTRRDPVLADGEIRTVYEHNQPNRPPAPWRRLAISVMAVVVAGCSAVATPSAAPTASATFVAAASASAPMATVASASTDANVSPLEGTWATGPVSIDAIKASMIAAGISPDDVDAWVAEVGRPTQFSYLLLFAGNAFTHSEETPDMAMQVGEMGTFELSGTQLVLSLGEPGNIDTYTFEATVAGDELSLRCVDSTEQGTPEAKATHRRFTIAFYCSAPFRRQP
jgi:hypothetical protein